MASKKDSKQEAPAQETKAEAPALDNNVKGSIERDPVTPTENEMRSSLQAWANAQAGAGATPEQIENALKSYELTGSAAGVIEEAKGPVGQWGVDTYPADWDKDEAPVA